MSPPSRRRGPVPEARSRGASSTARPCAAGLALLALALGGLGAACRCGPEPAELLAAAKDSPLHTIEAFATYARAGLYEQEYRCLSRGLVSGLSMATYCEVRERFTREHPLLDLLAKAAGVERLAEQALGAGRHRVDVRVGPRTVRVTLVREDLWRIRSGDEFVDDWTRFEDIVRIDESAPGEYLLQARVPLGAANLERSAITSVSIERLWKIDDVQELDAP